ncbi:MAG TPA: SGNH/GDSL hydrolase family protein [Phycisphaerae bacterium]|nr:SGNH/GDSL hydrolase family protein [Phycisphaerae bacterium]
MTTSNAFQIRDGQTVVFIGDSITDCGRQGAAAPYGGGYVQFAIDLIQARYPQRAVRFHNAGVDGHATSDLEARWADDVLARRPDWLSVLVGINDCHRFLFSAESQKDPIPVEEYRRTYAVLLARTRSEVPAVRFCLMDPFYVAADADPNTCQGKVLAALPAYIQVVRELAEEFGALHVPLHDLFQNQLTYRSAETLAGDAVHPTRAGHLLIAQAWLAAMGW